MQREKNSLKATSQQGKKTQTTKQKNPQRNKTHPKPNNKNIEKIKKI